jgi:hypothetical protein
MVSAAQFMEKKVLTLAAARKMVAAAEAEAKRQDPRFAARFFQEAASDCLHSPASGCSLDDCRAAKIR